MGEVRQHVPCRQCGYDLFGQTQGEPCPECGTTVSRSRKLRRPKNPRRQAPHFRRQLDSAHSRIKFGITGLTVSTLALVALLIWFPNLLLVLLVACVAVASLGDLLLGRSEHHEAKARLAEVEWRIENEDY